MFGSIILIEEVDNNCVPKVDEIFEGFPIEKPFDHIDIPINGFTRSTHGMCFVVSVLPQTRST